MNAVSYLKNIGVRTLGILVVLVMLFLLFLHLYSQRLLPAWIFAVWGAGCIIVIGLNIHERLDQLRKKGESPVTTADEQGKKGSD